MRITRTPSIDLTGALTTTDGVLVKMAEAVAELGRQATIAASACTLWVAARNTANDRLDGDEEKETR